MGEKIRLVIADDQKLFASSMKIVIERSSRNGIEVVGIANDGREAVALVKELDPDVILMDIRMPNMDGVEATRLIHESKPETRVIMLTTFDDSDYVARALAGGAHGYIIKDIQPDELVASIRMVYTGAYLFAPVVGLQLADRVAGGTPREANVHKLLSTFDTLSRREAEVLDLVLQSYDNSEIADRLTLSEQTVRNYTSTIYAKLGVADRIHAVRFVRGKLPG